MHLDRGISHPKGNCLDALHAYVRDGAARLLDAHTSAMQYVAFAVCPGWSDQLGVCVPHHGPLELYGIACLRLQWRATDRGVVPGTVFQILRPRFHPATATLEWIAFSQSRVIFNGDIYIEGFERADYAITVDYPAPAALAGRMANAIAYAAVDATSSIALNGCAPQLPIPYLRFPAGRKPPFEEHHVVDGLRDATLRRLRQTADIAFATWDELVKAVGDEAAVHEAEITYETPAILWDSDAVPLSYFTRVTADNTYHIHPATGEPRPEDGGRPSHWINTRHGVLPRVAFPLGTELWFDAGMLVGSDIRPNPAIDWFRYNRWTNKPLFSLTDDEIDELSNRVDACDADTLADDFRPFVPVWANDYATTDDLILALKNPRDPLIVSGLPTIQIINLMSDPDVEALEFRYPWGLYAAGLITDNDSEALDGFARNAYAEGRCPTRLRHHQLIH